MARRMMYKNVLPKVLECDSYRKVTNVIEKCGSHREQRLVALRARARVHTLYPGYNPTTNWMNFQVPFSRTPTGDWLLSIP